MQSVCHVLVHETKNYITVSISYVLVDGVLFGLKLAYMDVWVNPGFSVCDWATCS